MAVVINSVRLVVYVVGMSRRPRSSGAMHVVTNKRQGRHREYVTHLLRRSYREDGKVKNETLANLSHLPPDAIELIRGALRGESYVPAGEAFEIERSLSAGHVMAALSMARRLDLARLLDRSPSRERDLVMAMIAQRVIAPASKLATVRSLSQSILAEELNVTGADEDDLYAALDWLLDRQEKIEDRLARRHLKDGEAGSLRRFFFVFRGAFLSAGETRRLSDLLCVRLGLVGCG